MAFKFALLFIAAQVCTTLALPPCVCTRNLKPVCGSDGKTYGNQCLLDCERTNNQELSMVREGSCDVETPLCTCNFDYRPVCGTDGTTYPNRCSLTCQQSRTPDLQMDHEGQCSEKVKVVDVPPCTCTREMKLVCGSDGKTYGNDCLLNCATATNNFLSIAHTGPCAEKVVVEQTPLPACTCTREMKEVCGSDGKTYGNDCLLNCATATNNLLRIAHKGPCEKVNENKPVQHGCICARNLEPVCGKDGKTYSNMCMMNCRGAQLARQGPCDGSQ